MRKLLDKSFVITYCLISYFPDVIAFFWILLLGEYRQEFSYAKLKVSMPNEDIVFLFLCCVLVFIISIIIFYFYFQTKKFCFSSKLSFSFLKKKLEIYLILIMFLNMILLLTTGVGKAGGEYKSSLLSSLLAMLNFEFFFWVYFIEYYSKRNSIYYLICGIYILLNLLQGWSNFILQFFFVILGLSEEKQKKKILLVLPFIYLGGGALYTFVYPLKNFIRFGKYFSISYGEGLLALTERLTKFPNVCVAVQNKNKIIDLYYSFNSKVTEIISFFYPWVPGFIIPNKSTRVFNNLIMLSVYPSYSETISAGTGLSYIFLLGKLSWFYPFILVFIYLVYFILNKTLADSLISNRKSSNILPFFVSFYLLRGYALRQYGLFIPVLFTFAFLVLLGVIKLKRK